ncbi:hypothetical protein [Mucilaginibacter sp. OK098]|uniref:hypothetical protein n=1 Tax=Mucilaginibacter sp. OK098 TaxID=1855297 RepID=UPI00091D6D77|nr:hypothetical protein [Mucilaginibacter sp. OK098]SHN30260.1 hypothetical protein SAMN05216524_1098 [Mucilaginibacter sp. OK098]
MNFFFDYIFYRITQFMFKRDGRTGVTALIFMSLSQAFFLELIINPIIKNFLTKEELAHYSKFIGWFGAIIFVALFLINNKKYKNSYNKYRFYWKDENTNKRFYKGILVILSLIIPISLYILMNVHWGDS